MLASDLLPFFLVVFRYYSALASFLTRGLEDHLLNFFLGAEGGEKSENEIVLLSKSESRGLHT